MDSKIDYKLIQLLEVKFQIHIVFDYYKNNTNNAKVEIRFGMNIMSCERIKKVLLLAIDSLFDLVACPNV